MGHVARAVKNGRIVKLVWKGFGLPKYVGGSTAKIVKITNTRYLVGECSARVGQFWVSKKEVEEITPNE